MFITKLIKKKTTQEDLGINPQRALRSFKGLKIYEARVYER